MTSGNNLLYGAGDIRPVGLEREYGLGISKFTLGNQNTAPNLPFTPSVDDRQRGEIMAGVIHRIVNANGMHNTRGMTTFGRIYNDCEVLELDTNEYEDYLDLAYAQVGMDLIAVNGIFDFIKHSQKGAGITAQLTIGSSDEYGNYWGGVHTNLSMSRQAFGKIVEPMYTPPSEFLDYSPAAHNDVVKQLATYLVASATVMGVGSPQRIANTKSTYMLHPFERLHAMQDLINDQTTEYRPIVNRRDETHGNVRKHARLHVISQDAKLHPLETFLDVACLSAMLRTIELDLPLPYWFYDPLNTLFNIKRDPEYAGQVTVRGEDKQQDLTARQVFAETIQFLLQTGKAQGFPDQEIAALQIVADGLDLYEQGDRTSAKVQRVHPWLYKQEFFAANNFLDTNLTPDQVANLHANHRSFNTYAISASGIIEGNKLKQLRPQKIVDRAMQQALTPPPTRAAERADFINNVPYGFKIDRAHWDRIELSDSHGNRIFAIWSSPKAGSMRTVDHTKRLV